MPEVTVDGVRINYRDSGGPGAACLLLHAFPLDSEMWEPQFESLGERFRLIAPDFQGFGQSDVVEDRSTYSMDTFAAQAKGALDDAGVSTVVVAGLSMGGYAAFAFWRSYRDTVAGLVLADTRAEADAPENIEKRTSQQEAVGEKGPGALTDGLLGALLSESTRTKKPEVVEQVRNFMDNPAAGYIGALEAMKTRPDSVADLATINVPTLVIVGENDAITPAELSRMLHEHIAGSTLNVIPEVGHLSNLEEPEAFSAALSGFLSAS